MDAAIKTLIGMVTEQNSWEEKLMRVCGGFWADKCMKRPPGRLNTAQRSLSPACEGNRPKT